MCSPRGGPDEPFAERKTIGPLQINKNRRRVQQSETWRREEQPAKRRSHNASMASNGRRCDEVGEHPNRQSRSATLFAFCHTQIRLCEHRLINIQIGRIRKERRRAKSAEHRRNRREWGRGNPTVLRFARRLGRPVILSKRYRGAYSVAKRGTERSTQP